MSGTRSPSRTAPATRPRPSLKLRLLLWPFVTAAVAINLFLLGLIGIAVGLPVIRPVTALWASVPLGLPATWAAARWVARLIAEAEGPPAKLTALGVPHIPSSSGKNSESAGT